jgi:hypothetical protein
MTKPEPRPLPANPNLSHLKKRAKDLKKGLERSDAEAMGRLNAVHPSAPSAPFSLRDAQLTTDPWFGLAS